MEQALAWLWKYRAPLAIVALLIAANLGLRWYENHLRDQGADQANQARDLKDAQQEVEQTHKNIETRRKQNAVLNTDINAGTLDNILRERRF